MAVEDIRALIEKLASLAPEFCEIKTIPVKGIRTRFVKLVSKDRTSFGEPTNKIMDLITARL